MVVFVDEGEVDFTQLFPGGDPPAAGTILDLQELQNFESDLEHEEFFPQKILEMLFSRSTDV